MSVLGTHQAPSPTPPRHPPAPLPCHSPIPGPTRLVDPNRVRGTRPYIGTLLSDFFFQSRTCTCGYGPHLITESKYHIHIKRTTTGVVSIKIYTHITKSHLLIHIQKQLYIPITYSERRTYYDEPLLVCWPSCMRMFLDVFSCTYTD